ncbi:DUF6511 domain-containing protein [Ralstonia pseudosolanacearum]|uniref:DUF6511 domain-containing protein n=1 Tax=Ralstonia pseudosolanacearum TaxID=1310165 RepID=UPI0026771CF4|nr:DUF6511 domain-containing protein [Ralstonia pseudosolanacearum]MDO3513274.1 DUF6511 domain-containing protein [Ralstonia pseudosolanacearum]MDO3536497.1 DUF6511 domain-containing protein [Ralstonia pseudosolanacearum]MDO3605329.1 DUF6511 domain-containing protein [Ralstonia pseudosolanacearum]MDO3611776.1 DUF6511 domain-containing protein [Ralstonia pseudosolanacearum]MDO3630896.1 DUF6511 domain-containing protein [Ralstonia pseudosolanacearum]
MKCWVCKRQARGFTHADTRHGVGDPRRFVPDWVFCSRRCQDAFHALYGNWRRAMEGQHREGSMLDASDIERTAMRTCLKAFGRVADEIGFTKPLAAYTEAEALRVIDAIVTRYTEAMVEHHETTRMPPVLGSAAAKATAQDPFAELEELPWETTEGDA